MLVISIALVGGAEITLSCGDNGKDISRGITLGGIEPVCLDALPQVFIVVIHALEHLHALHQHKLVQRGHVGGTQLIALDDSRQRGHRYGLEGLGLSEALLDEFGYLFVKLLAVPLAHVGGHFLHGIVAVAPSSIAVTVVLIDHRLKVVQQSLDVGLLFLGDNLLDALDDVGHIVLRDTALGDTVTHQRIDGQLSVTALERLVQIGQRLLRDVLRIIEVNDFLVLTH